MRVFTIISGSLGVTESDALPTELPAQGFVWIACARREFEVMLAPIQSTLQLLCGTQLVDLHVSDLLNNQLPSHYDYTSQYDMLVFRRLAAGHTETDLAHPGEPLHQPSKRSGPPVLKRIDTSPVGFAVFDRVLLTVHPASCTVRDAYALKLLNATSSESRANGVKLPASPADLMLRVVNQMVDGYLALRRELTRQMDHWQSELLKPGSRFTNWNSVLDARLALHLLDEICEDQRAALQDWIDSIETWPDADTPLGKRERELLKVRSRDVLEHIERVVHHVRRLEQSAETAVQMHFSAQSNRTNDIMRTLTALTAVFLPLNLITGFFGMNFEFLPAIHSSAGFWWTFGLMVSLVVVVVSVFWRKRYLARVSR
ncbi:Magnesium and cobalt transport protein CorA [Polaromonas sp. CG9_12]|uniref:magnesium transporter CorA family protein n=1 Tax=Polaromonas sp. CG_9.11 TaxID=2787730 RepID=UPI0004DDDC85|nr:magnesium transporter CorA family protein [Polaromonas sp. CG_9.11]MBG6075682.1 Mg2+ and Co2+ transporter CorA [Polaromonas sp. CG_9.11]CDS52497.1 Magnesium and cobalt transport protein CorA [Polaromonas sp. CG9_12]